MTTDDLKKLKEDLLAKLKFIDDQLKRIASENPLVKGDFDVNVEDLGTSPDDTSQEMSELDRNQALVDQLERERKDIINTLEKIEKEAYGKCEKCSKDISAARLKAVPVAALCMSCARISK